MGVVNTADPRDIEPLDALRALQDRERQLAQAKRELIAVARARGRSWSEIGGALGVTKQAAWQLYSDEVTALLDRVAERSGLGEEEAMELARAELAAVRRAPRATRAS